jgi:predicted GIY-YIG superfamily endonuclease
MRRRRRAQAADTSTSGHHNVYVVLLDDVVNRLRKVSRANPDRDPAKPSVYVGLTGLDPEQRFQNHKLGIRSVSLVRYQGVRLMPELYAHLNPMPYDAAAQMERDLAEDLRREGYAVMGGH